jgi:hypothetical protein
MLPQFAADPRHARHRTTEPDNASNYFLPYPTPFRTSAKKTPGGWIVNGMKHFISNGNRASFYLLFVQTEPGKPMGEGASCFLLERGRSGFTFGRVHDKMGSGQTCGITKIAFPTKSHRRTGGSVCCQFFRRVAHAAANVLCGGALHKKAIDCQTVRAGRSPDRT